MTGATRFRRWRWFLGTEGGRVVYPPLPFYPSHSLLLSFSLFTFVYRCTRHARTHARVLRIFTNTRTPGRNVVRRHRAATTTITIVTAAPLPPLFGRALPDRPGRAYRRRTDYHFSVWRPFRRAHSNLLARVRIFIKKGPRWRNEPGSLSLSACPPRFPSPAS